MKRHMRILSGNMGVGWADQKVAAIAYSEWVMEHNPGITAEVIYATGVGGGMWDEKGELPQEYEEMWRSWCESEEAKKYFAE